MGVVGSQSDKPKIERKSKAGCVLSRKEEEKEENKEQQQPQHRDQHLEWVEKEHRGKCRRIDFLLFILVIKHTS